MDIVHKHAAFVKIRKLSLVHYSKPSHRLTFGDLSTSSSHPFFYSHLIRTPWKTWLQSLSPLPWLAPTRLLVWGQGDTCLSVVFPSMSVLWKSALLWSHLSDALLRGPQLSIPSLSWGLTYRPLLGFLLSSSQPPGWCPSLSGLRTWPCILSKLLSRCPPATLCPLSVLQMSHPCSCLRTFALTPPLLQRSSHWCPQGCFYLRIQTLAQIPQPQKGFPWWPQSFLVSSRISRLLICWLIIVLHPFPATAGVFVPLEPRALMSWSWLHNNTWHLLKRYLLSKWISGEAIVLQFFSFCCFFFLPGCVYRLPLFQILFPMAAL